MWEDYQDSNEIKLEEIGGTKLEVLKKSLAKLIPVGLEGTHWRSWIQAHKALNLYLPIKVNLRLQMPKTWPRITKENKQEMTNSLFKLVKISNLIKKINLMLNISKNLKEKRRLRNKFQKYLHQVIYPLTKWKVSMMETFYAKDNKRFDLVLKVMILHLLKSPRKKLVVIQVGMYLWSQENLKSLNLEE